MQKKHLVLAILVTLVWGVNFPITKLGLRSIDPFVLTGIRFALAAIPLVFFIKRPAIKFSYVVAYGFIFGLGMWGVINYGIQVGVSPGIASLIIQLSVFFTMGWGALLFKEKLRRAQLIGALLALVGLAGIISTQQGEHAILGVLLIVLSAVAWSVGNVIIKTSGVKEIFSFMVWASLFPPIPLFFIAWLMQGAAPFENLQSSLDLTAVLSIIFQVYLATHFAYWGWNSLLKLYPVSTVAPLSLLIPVFGIGSSMLIIGEHISTLNLISIAIIIMGLAVGLYRKSADTIHAAPRATLRSD
ncbi:O-acetylserine/cysteine efflux transporter [Pseudomonas sp. PvR086]|jgi:O-acetylserine/cysteine efflux transporter|uniref:EamA family transporter n=1 Tax=Pseudomonas TaxID=286 RepID=UPI000B3592FC|nr:MULTISPECIES: EamA family transporter [Pseudomonas]MDR7108583.1 O-acetylserine/cysteine efflux transporter [Pseudomonas frederiksbergensis]PMY54537.1 EamA family transporter [Pseudomonas sp. FW305-53]PMY87948.1 EamA family transporter [Pseudomonas sp. FW303-C2]PMY93104.1 EamA family transporter [Pseudomonas sp. FW305-62]PNA44138.1 EamA family transporter [Pseudomonas sp. FW306-2-2C-A10BC]